MRIKTQKNHARLGKNVMLQVQEAAKISHAQMVKKIARLWYVKTTCVQSVTLMRKNCQKQIAPMLIQMKEFGIHAVL